jgi:SAM-dependent methyltransferase
VNGVNRISPQALELARASAWPPGEDVGQESFISAGEIRSIAGRAGITAATSVLDLCCGVAGPGRLIARELGPDYLGVDRDPRSIEAARERARGLRCRFLVVRVPPLPEGRFDVVLLLETMLAFADKRPLVAAIADALVPGGRFAFTLEAGPPLTAAERELMPGGDTVWPTPLEAMRELLAEAGLAVCFARECTAEHAAAADALASAYAANAEAVAAEIGQAGLQRLLAAHRLWVQWLSSGRVRKYAMVAELPPSAH